MGIGENRLLFNGIIPLLLIEILTVPMALRVIRIAETLSASAETWGIDLKRRKSNYLSLRFSAWDAVFCVLLAASVSAGLIIQQSPYQLN